MTTKIEQEENKLKIKMEIMRVSEQLRYGDQYMIAELTGYHRKHVINTLNCKVGLGPSAAVILRVAQILIENRSELRERVKRELFTS